MIHTIKVSGKDLYAEWGLVPTSRPVVNPPRVKTTYQDLPSQHGQLDYTDYLLQEVPYGQREGSWEFRVKPKKGTWATVYSSIMNYLHGKQHTVILEDDPLFFYVGRLSVNEWQSNPNRSAIVIDYNFDPFKYSVTAVDDDEWTWNEIFFDWFHYRDFNVNGSKYRNFVNAGIKESIPTFTCSAPITVKYRGAEFNLVKGINYNSNFVLYPGDNEMQFIGYADVKVSYREVSL